MADVIETANLPPGWDCKYDPRTGRYYYVNLFTKTTTWEDPRNRFRQFHTPVQQYISNDSISQPLMHGSPYHVYPSSNSFYPAQAAFQNPPSGVPSLTSSPNLANKLQQIELSSSISKSNSPHTPHTPKMGVSRAVQETSFTTATDTETTVTKINSMFPTVPETHIRMLLKKYLKSIFPKAEETLILDVLAGADNNVQTASQQLIKMGYDKKDQAGPPKVNQRKSIQEEEQQKKEELIVSQPKLKTPEEKKKIKARLQLKYKDIAEKIISMALESVDYSEERAKQILSIVIQEDNEIKSKSAENKTKKVTIETPKHGADENKENAEEARQESEDDTDLNTKADEDDGAVINDTTNDDCNDHNNNDYSTNHLTISNQTTSSSSSRQSHRAKKIDHAKYSTFRNSSSEDDLENLDKKVLEYKALMYRTKPAGPNVKLFKGPNDDLLLADYVTWNGANPDLQLARHKLANGPNYSLRSDRKLLARGPSNDLCNGPSLGLAKGSIYSQMNCAMKADVKCN